MLNPNWLATTLSLFLMIVNIVKRNDYEWFHDNSTVLNLSALEQSISLSSLGKIWLTLLHHNDFRIGLYSIQILDYSYR